MKRFLFRLETLLQHRHNIEERERARFALIRNELLTEIGHRESLSARRAQLWSELAEGKNGEWDSQEIAWSYRFLEHLEREMKRSADRIAQLETKVETQKQVMIAASRDKKVIENLKSRRKREFMASLDREEQKLIDDLVVTRFANHGSVEEEG